MLATHYCGEGGSNPRGRQMRRLTENEIRQFYEAYRDMEAQDGPAREVGKFSQ